MSETTIRPSAIIILIGLVIALALPELPVQHVLAPSTTMAGHLERETYFWAITLVLVLYVLIVERRPLTTIGLRMPGWRTFVYGALGAIVLTAGIVIIANFVFPLLHIHMNQRAINNIKSTPFWFRLILVTRAAVFEEICYRGYTIERVTELTGSRWIAAAVSIVGFTLAHANYWGWSWLVVPFFGGVVLAGLYLWRRDLPCNMIAHFLSDGSGFLFG